MRAGWEGGLRDKIPITIYTSLLFCDSRTILLAFSKLRFTALSFRRRSRFPLLFAIFTRRARFRSISSAIRFRGGSRISSDAGYELGIVSKYRKYEMKNMKGKFGGNPDPVYYMSLKQVIRMFIQKLGLRLENMKSPLPFQPPLFRLLNYSVKGCYRWLKL